jgi:hypothetical protein
VRYTHNFDWELVKEEPFGEVDESVILNLTSKK